VTTATQKAVSICSRVTVLPLDERVAQALVHETRLGERDENGPASATQPELHVCQQGGPGSQR